MARRCSVRDWTAIVDRVTHAAGFPRDYHVVIERAPLVDCFGTAEAVDIDTGHFRLVVHIDLTEPHAADILIHEVAHVLDWRPLTPFTRDHGPTFWIYLGEVWCRYHGTY